MAELSEEAKAAAQVRTVLVSGLRDRAGEIRSMLMLVEELGGEKEADKLRDSALQLDQVAEKLERMLIK